MLSLFLRLYRSVYEYWMKDNLMICQRKKINRVALIKPFKWESFVLEDPTVLTLALYLWVLAGVSKDRVTFIFKVRYSRIFELSDREDKGKTSFRNVEKSSTSITAYHPRRHDSSTTPHFYFS